MNIDISKYNTIIFDCDGVILNSNKVKTQAFYDVARNFGHDAAKKLVEFHLKHGGISRFKKFEYLFKEILKVDYTELEFQKAIDDYAAIVRKALLSCEVAEGIEKLRNFTKKSRWLIASGGAQSELIEVFLHRGLTDLFDGGIYGSPTTKVDIVRQQIECGNITSPALFLGDSRYDHIAASKFDIDFIFVTQWSEFIDLDEYAAHNKLAKVEKLSSLLD